MTSAPTSATLLLEQLLAFHVAVRCHTAQHPPPLSLSEGQLLGEIAVRGHAEIDELSTQLRLNRSTISRTLKRMIASKLIVQTRDKADIRQKRFTPSRNGENLLHHDDRARSAVSEHLLSSLSEKSRLAVVQGFRKIADAYQIAVSAPRTGEHPLRPEQRRLTRAFGLMSENFLATDLSPTALQVLFFLKHDPEVPLTKIAAAVPYDTSTLSRSITKLLARSLVQERRSSDDRRASILHLTDAGISLLDALSTKVLTQARTTMVDDEIVSLVHALGQISFDRFDPRYLSARHATTVEAKSLSEYDAARAFLIQQMVHEQRHHHLPATVLRASSRVFVLSFGDRIVACCGWGEPQPASCLPLGARNPSLVPAKLYYVLLERLLREIDSPPRSDKLTLIPENVGLTEMQCEYLNALRPLC